MKPQTFVPSAVAIFNTSDVLLSYVPSSALECLSLLHTLSLCFCVCYLCFLVGYHDVFCIVCDLFRACFACFRYRLPIAEIVENPPPEIDFDDDLPALVYTDVPIAQVDFDIPLATPEDTYINELHVAYALNQISHEDYQFELSILENNRRTRQQTLNLMRQMTNPPPLRRQTAREIFRSLSTSSSDSSERIICPGAASFSSLCDSSFLCYSILMTTYVSIIGYFIDIFDRICYFFFGNRVDRFLLILHQLDLGFTIFPLIHFFLYSFGFNYSFHSFNYSENTNFLLFVYSVVGLFLLWLYEFAYDRFAFWINLLFMYSLTHAGFVSVIPWLQLLLQGVGRLATFRTKSRDRAQCDFDYHGARVVSQSFDDRNQVTNLRSLKQLKGVTFVHLANGTCLTFQYPLLHVSEKDFLIFLRTYVKSNADYRLYRYITPFTESIIHNLYLASISQEMQHVFQSERNIFDAIIWSPFWEESCKALFGPIMPFLEFSIRMSTLETFDWKEVNAYIIPLVFHLLSIQHESYFLRFFAHVIFNSVVLCMHKYFHMTASLGMFPLYVKGSNGLVQATKLKANSFADSTKSFFSPMTMDEYTNLLVINNVNEIESNILSDSNTGLEVEAVIENTSLTSGFLRSMVNGTEIEITTALPKENVESPIPDISKTISIKDLTLENLIRHKSTRDLTAVVLIGKSLMNLDLIGVLGQLVVCDWVYPLYHLIFGTKGNGLNDTDMRNAISHYISDVIQDIKSDLKVNIRLTGDFEEKKPIDRVLARVLSLFPEGIRASPTLKHVFSLSICLIGCLIFQDFYVLKKALTTIVFPFSAITAENVVDGIFSLIEGIARVCENGEWKSFFKPPEMVLLREEVDSILMTEPHTTPVLIDLVDRSSKAIKKIHYSSDPYVARAVPALMAKHSLCIQLLENARSRSPPKLVFMAGSPGTGKTEGFKRVLAAYESYKGYKIDPAMIGNIDISVKHPAEGVSHKSKVLFINETIADCSEDIKSDKIPFEVYLQRFMDAAPLLFKSAKVENKGRFFNDVELIVITSNPTSFVFSSEVDKLTRRFQEHAIVVKQELVEYDEEGKFTILANDPNDKKFLNINNLIHFKMMRTFVKDRHLTFQLDPASEWLKTPYFLIYMIDRFMTHDARIAKSVLMTKSKCTCGVDYPAHFDGAQFIPLGGLCTEIDLPSQLTHELCCDCGVSSIFHRHDYDPIHWSDSQYKRDCIQQGSFKGKYTMTCETKDLVTEEEKIPVTAARVEKAFQASRAYDFRSRGKSHSRFIPRRYACDDEEDDDGSYSLTGEYDSLYVFISFLFVFNVMYPQQCFSFYGKSYQLMRDFWMNSTVIKDIKQSTKNIDAVTAKINSEIERLKVEEKYFKDGLLQFGYMFGLIGLAGVGGFVVKQLIDYIKTETKLTSAPGMLREDVQPESMHVDYVSLEKSYPEDLAATWRKVAQNIPMGHLKRNGVGSNQLIERLKPSVYKARFFYANGEPAKGYALKISSQYLMMNRHYLFEKGDVQIQLFQATGNEDVLLNSFCTNFSSCSPIYHNDELTDNLIVPFSFQLLGKDLIKYFPESINFKQCDGFVYHPSETNVPHNIHFSEDDLTEIGYGRCGIWQHKNPGLDGHCGRPLVLCMNGSTYLGGIVAFRKDQGIFKRSQDAFQGGFTILKEDIIKAIQKFDVPFISEVYMPFKELKPLSHRSDMRDVSGPFLMTLGSDDSPQSTFKSSYKRSQFYDMTMPRCSKLFGIPDKTRFLKDGEWITSVKQTFKNCPGNEIYFDPKLDLAVNTFFKHIKTEVRKRYPNMKLSPLSVEETFFGDQEQMIDRVNFKSSCGPDKSYGATRNHLFESFDGKYKYRMKPQFRDAYDKFSKMVSEGYLEALRVSGQYKDEPRPQSKLDEGKIRIFFLVCLFWNTLSRQYVGPLRAFLLRIPEISSIFAQIDSSSEMWENLAQFLKISDPNFMWIDMDFTNFDMTHRILFEKVARLMYLIALEFYGDEKAANIVYFCMIIMLCQIFSMKGDWVMKIAGLPSGSDITLVLNSLVNVLLMIYAYIIIFPERDPISFFSNVRPATTGDDNLSAVHKDTAVRYNLLTISPIYANLGYKVTNGSKGATLQPFVDKDKATFLKRRFLYNPEVGQHLAAIEEDSIWKSLSFTDNSEEHISETERLSQCVDTALREFFFHGRDKYNQEVIFLSRVVENRDIDVYFYSYDELLTMYKNKEFKMNWI